jgi:enoyl-CoA hydratase
MSFDNLLLERDGAVAVLTLNRPQVLNALNTPTLDELSRALQTLQDDASVRVVIVTGAGRAFVAGADISELAALDSRAAVEYARRGQRVFDRIEHLGKPVIAAVNGYALGGGCELAMACTLRVAADSARFGQPEIELGLIPGYGGTQRLPRLVGKGAALDLLLTGRHVDADEALRLGLVNRVVPSAGLMATARELAASLASKAPVAVRFVLDSVDRGCDGPHDDAQGFEASLFGLLAATADMHEGTSAFLAKRRPVFRGR